MPRGGCVRRRRRNFPRISSPGPAGRRASTPGPDGPPRRRLGMRSLSRGPGQGESRAGAGRRPQPGPETKEPRPVGRPGWGRVLARSFEVRSTHAPVPLRPRISVAGALGPVAVRGVANRLSRMAMADIYRRFANGCQGYRRAGPLPPPGAAPEGSGGLLRGERAATFGGYGPRGPGCRRRPPHGNPGTRLRFERRMR